jgi:hypothetical protein
VQSSQSCHRTEAARKLAGWRWSANCQLPTPLNYGLFARWRNAPISSIGDCASPPTANQGGLAGCECAPSFPGTVSLPTQSVAKEVTGMLNGSAVLQRRGCVTVLVVREQQQRQPPALRSSL